MTAHISVSRINRFDADRALQRDGALDFVFDRILGWDAAAELFAGVPPRDAAAFRAHVHLALLHEFDVYHDHFGWHADTKPGDRAPRTWNINVMLSARPPPATH